MRDYLITALLKKPAWLSRYFVTEGYLIDLGIAKAESTVKHYNAMARLVFGSPWDDEDEDDRDFAFSDGIAMIPVTGVLLNRFGYSYSGATGYNAIRAQLQSALADPDVKGIVFDINSPGGAAQGCMELSDEIYAARGVKPLMAVVDANCTSAAYALASGADSIVATRSADIGSIGVLCMHVDLSGALEQEGVDVTFIYAGAHKIDGNPYSPLPKGVKADWQADIDASYQDFVSIVARNRGLTTQAVRNTEASVYGAQDALNLGLIDSVSTPQEAITAFRSELTSGSLSTLTIGVLAMTEKVVAGTAATEAAPDLKAVASAAAAEAITAERARIDGIMTCDEAKERTALATHLALKTAIPLAEAKGILSASPLPQAATATATTVVADNAFAKAMAKDNPNVSAGDDNADKPVDPVKRILANYAQATGQVQGNAA